MNWAQYVHMSYNGDDDNNGVPSNQINLLHDFPLCFILLHKQAQNWSLWAPRQTSQMQTETAMQTLRPSYSNWGWEEWRETSFPMSRPEAHKGLLIHSKYPFFLLAQLLDSEEREPPHLPFRLTMHACNTHTSPPGTLKSKIWTTTRWQQKGRNFCVHTYVYATIWQEGGQEGRARPIPTGFSSSLSLPYITPNIVLLLSYYDWDGSH